MEKLPISILEKLRGHYLSGTPVGEVADEDYERIKASIRDHLELLLNEHSGVLEHVDAYFRDVKNSKGYGMPELSEFFFNHSQDKETRRERLRQALEHLIKTFEPRLTNVQIEDVDENKSAGSDAAFVSMAMRYHLKASLKKREDVAFETVFLPDKPAKVEEIDT